MKCSFIHCRCRLKRCYEPHSTFKENNKITFVRVLMPSYGACWCNATHTFKQSYAPSYNIHRQAYLVNCRLNYVESEGGREHIVRVCRTFSRQCTLFVCGLCCCWTCLWDRFIDNVTRTINKSSTRLLSFFRPAFRAITNYIIQLNRLSFFQLPESLSFGIIEWGFQ